jgi:hypothetical protein
MATDMATDPDMQDYFERAHAAEPARPARKPRERDEPCESFKGRRDDLCATCGWGHCYHPVMCLGYTSPGVARVKDGPLREEMGKLLRFPDPR